MLGGHKLTDSVHMLKAMIHKDMVTRVVHKGGSQGWFTHVQKTEAVFPRAEAERMRMKASAYKQYGDAAILSLVLEALPQVHLLAPPACAPPSTS